MVRPGVAAGGGTTVLAFDIDAYRFALLLNAVHQVIRAVAITRLPKAPAIVDGVIDLRGRLAPVLDIRSRFGLPGKPPSTDEHFIIAEAGQRIVALRVDQALDVVRIPAGEIDDINAVVGSAEYITGVARLDEGLVLIHDLETFLTASEALSIDVAIETIADGDW